MALRGPRHDLDPRPGTRDKPLGVLPVHGFCDLRFGAVLDVFRDGFARGDEHGAAVAAMVDGALVVDLWAGHADRAAERPWSRNTLAPVGTVTEMLVALCVLMLADAGIVELDVPVARYWPEFGDHGKVPITIRHVLTHRAGLPDLREPLAPEELLDWDGVVRRLAAEPPWSPPGEVVSHARTAGFLLGEIVRRVSGRGVGAFFHDEIARPLGLDVHLGGLGPDQDHRLTDLLEPHEAPAAPQLRAWRQAEIPTANGHATARGLARLMATLARGGEFDGVRILNGRVLAQATRELVHVADPPTRLGLGFALAATPYPFADAARAFGAADAAGATAFADPEADAGMAYTPNRCRAAAGGPDPRAVALVRALYESL